MKRLLFIIPSAILILGAVPIAVNALSPKPVEPIAPTIAVQAPVKPQVVEIVPEPTPAPTVVQEAPTVVTTPTNEDLISQYGWTNNRESIDYIIEMFPTKFTESEREASFAYLHLVASSNKVLGTEPVRTIDSIDFIKWYFQQHYRQESWVNVGILAGVN